MRLDIRGSHAAASSSCVDLIDIDAELAGEGGAVLVRPAAVELGPSALVLGRRHG